MEENYKPLSRKEIEKIPYEKAAGLISIPEQEKGIIADYTKNFKPTATYFMVWNTADKVKALGILSEELERDNLTDPSKIHEEDIDKLKFGWRTIKNEISEAKEFAKVTQLSDKRLNQLIGEIKILLSYQNRIERRLFELTSAINPQEETEFERSFDFELEPKVHRAYLPNYLKIIEKINKEIALIDNIEKKPSNKFPSNHKEKAGLHLATQNIEMYLNDKKNGIKDGFKAPDIAEKIGLDRTKHRLYISGTLNNYMAKDGNGAKNIFNNTKLMLEIETHCSMNNLTMTSFFQEKLNDLKAKQDY
ncbi:hypothetical protein [Arenibacter sp. F20364]|uniref:hypothetical protein n=1 Tax=Arenibacter sp. F20364 TaxID=2926415 RepID=UPI001FF585AB|nr:hypothetical protein [Arenibacter sp. F20364]MCK0190654.1 hypothetical protein [Arenibacter sp. F20364]